MEYILPLEGAVCIPLEIRITISEKATIFYIFTHELVEL
jgi:hypothetical protein